MKIHKWASRCKRKRREVLLNETALWISTQACFFSEGKLFGGGEGGGDYFPL